MLDEWEASAIGDWIFGCDVCQEVCPVNADADDDGPLLVPLLPLIEWLLPLGGRAFARAVGATALTRAGRHRLLRNAIAALGNVAERPALADDRCWRARRATRGPRFASRRCATLAAIGSGDERRPLAFHPMPRVAPFAGLHYSLARFGSATVPDRVRMADDADAPPTTRGRPDRPRLPAVRRHRRRAADGAAGARTTATRCASSSAPSRTPTRRRRTPSPRGLPTARSSGATSRPRTTTATRRHRRRTIRPSRGWSCACCSSRGAAGSGRTSTPCPGRRPTGSRCCAAPAPS